MYRDAKKHFRKADPILYKAAKLHAVDDIVRSGDVFVDLVNAVVNQQLSSKAAATIYGRLEKLAGNSGVTPRTILKLNTGVLRKCGLSEAKVQTLKGLAQAISNGKLELDIIHTHSDEKVVELLTSIKGIGPWTVEMILMSSLGRTDIFSKGDLGLRKGIMRLYGLSKMPSNRMLDKLSRAWSPYRTYAARVLWRVADDGCRGFVSTPRVPTLPGRG